MPTAPPSPSPRPEQTFFADPAIDRLLGVTMALAAEVYILRERVRELDGARAAGDATPDEDAAAFVHRLLEPLRGEQQAKGPL